ncbi:MAG: DUF3991 domain-containing protein [Ruminococcus sp.]|nr:DUF3991 domain-containing protein [Ruminococcus sp.]
MSKYKHYTEEQIQQAKNVDLSDFVRKHGFKLQTVGREIHVKGYGGLYINPDKNIFSIFSQSKADGSPQGGKGALAFCQKVMGMTFSEAMKTLVGEAAEIRQYMDNENSKIPKEKKIFKAPEKSGNNKRVYAYLINQRRISPKIINDFIKQGVLYQGYTESVKGGEKTQRENAVFLHRNEKGMPCGAQIQGINSFSRFKQNVAPDETDKGFVYTKGESEKADTVYLFEAPIDLMSFVELHPEITNAKFVAMGGLKPSIADKYISSGVNVVSCVDNDKAGQEFNNRILTEKMLQSLSASCDDITAKIIKAREPPITMLEADINGKECSFFISENDYKDAVSANADIRKSAFIWVNKSNFTANCECAEAGVKDFNDLLKSVKSEQNTVSPQAECIKFIFEANAVAEWSVQASEKAAERLNETHRINTR